MFKLWISTQVYENYAAHTYNGVGPAPTPYWKAKGGHEYLVARISLAEAAKGKSHLFETYIKPALPHIERNDHWFQEHMHDWDITPINEPIPAQAFENRWADDYVSLPMELTQIIAQQGAAA